MTRLDWESRDRLYHYGVDRGVLYFGTQENQEAVVWNGLVSVGEQVTESRGNPLYFDGICYTIEQEISDYQASIEAFVYPYMLESHLLALGDGRSFYGDERELMPFGFTYRTHFGEGYLIHLVYNITAVLDGVVHNTLSDRSNLNPFRFTFHTTPVNVPNCRPTGHLIIDTNEADISKVFELEKILYGSEFTKAYFPTADELVDLFTS